MLELASKCKKKNFRRINLIEADDRQRFALYLVIFKPNNIKSQTTSISKHLGTTKKMLTTIYRTNDDNANTSDLFCWPIDKTFDCFRRLVFVVCWFCLYIIKNVNYKNSSHPGSKCLLQ